MHTHINRLVYLKTRKLSKPVTELIEAMLEKDPKKRITVEKLLVHPALSASTTA